MLTVYSLARSENHAGMLSTVLYYVFYTGVLNMYIMVMTHHSLSPQSKIWGILLRLRGRMVRRICVKEVSVWLVSYTHFILL